MVAPSNDDGSEGPASRPATPAFVVKDGSSAGTSKAPSPSNAPVDSEEAFGEVSSPVEVGGAVDGRGCGCGYGCGCVGVGVGVCVFACGCMVVVGVGVGVRDGCGCGCVRVCVHMRGSVGGSRLCV